jgi:hypothetical protein
MEFPWGVAAVIGVIVGVLTMVFGFRKKEQKPFVFDSIDGTPKQDWTRTGNIDFYVAALENAGPQTLVLRVEEKKLFENAMGQDVTQFRWRLATIEDAKEVVACWNARKAERDHER